MSYNRRFLRASLGMASTADESQRAAESSADSDEHVNSSAGGSDGDLDAEEERPGRFYGPDSSWRLYTQDERAVVAALDQAQCNDLSIHLFNVHAWKQLHRDRDLNSKTQPWNTKQNWVALDADGNLPFIPRPSWTAWPLDPADVPRSREQWGIPVTSSTEQSDVLQRPQSWRPGSDLEEELKAIMLRTAKNTFLRRPSATTEDLNDSDGISSTSTRSSTTPESTDEEVDAADDTKRSSIPMIQSRHEELGRQYLPMFLADDDEAGAITKPTVKHIIQQLDGLLAGLHKSRKGHRQSSPSSNDRTETAHFRSRARSRNQNRASASAKRKRLNSYSAQHIEDEREFDMDVNVDPIRPRLSRSQAESVQHQPLWPRDWSEVIGIASMIGFNQTVIDRAARRCVATFGETLTMRTMPETSALHTRDETVHYTPDMVPPIEQLLEDDVQTSSEHDVRTLYTCPRVSCRRHGEPFPQRFRWRDHLARVHRHTYQEIYEMEKTFASGDAPPADGSHEHAHDQRKRTGKNRSIPSDAVRQDGFLETITIPLRKPGDKQAEKG